MRKVFVTGAAGFIGSTLVDSLLSRGDNVVGWDNLSTGNLEFIAGASGCPQFGFIKGDNLDLKALTAAMQGCDYVFHLAANADVRFGLDRPSRDLEQNTLATFNVLEAMRANKVRGIAFSSTGSVYGEAEVIPTPETHPFPIQTSLYGASKLAGEGLIQAYCEGFGMYAHIFRFVSILGARYTHGHVFDFCKQLFAHPDYLDILGDGNQRKSYLAVSDCIRAMLHVTADEHGPHTDRKVQIYNLGTDEYCTVRDSIGWICAKLGLCPALNFSGGARGWPGDNPFIYLDTATIRESGWRPELTIRRAIESTVDWLLANPWVFNRTGDWQDPRVQATEASLV